VAKVLDECTVGAEFQQRIAGLRAGDVDVAILVGENRVLRLRPTRHHIGLTPGFEQVTGSVEFQDCGCSGAAFRLTFCNRVLLEVAWAVEHPDMVIFVHEQARDAAERPMVRQRFGPLCIIFVLRWPIGSGERRDSCAKGSKAA
jgi:hypothetical protein